MLQNTLFIFQQHSMSFPNAN